MMLSISAEQLLLLDAVVQQRLLKAIAECTRHESAVPSLPALLIYFQAVISVRFQASN
jgi:hypothetical protein